MSDNWVVQNLEKALNVWNDKLSEIWQLITQSPTSFKGGTLWNVVSSIHGALQAIGYALLVLFFVIGVMKTCGSLTLNSRKIILHFQYSSESSIFLEKRREKCLTFSKAYSIIILYINRKQVLSWHWIKRYR